MANDSKYIRLYPERAVALARSTLENLSRGVEVDSEAADAAIDALDTLGFPPDEPLLLLRGQDELAPEVVRRYAEEVERTGAFGGRDRNGEAVQHLIDHADDMERWQPRKLPD